MKIKVAKASEVYDSTLYRYGLGGALSDLKQLKKC